MPLVLHSPLWLLALAALPLLAWLRSRRQVPVLLVPFASAWHRTSLASPSRWPVALAFAGLALLIVALARPQRIEDKREVRSEGYDLILAIDVSNSMLFEEGSRPGESPNRLQTVKPVIQDFISRRPHDRIGVVLFGRKAYTLAPLTFDHAWISRQLERVKVGVVDPAGTVVGDGLGTALARLQQEDRMVAGARRGAFVILLTDGGESTDQNNQPLSLIPPLEAARIARNRQIPVHTIGAGRDGWVWIPVTINGQLQYAREFRRDVDPELLQQIAADSGGQFYRAEDKDTVERAFAAIDRAQKIEFQAQSHLITTELFWWLAAPGLSALLVAAALTRTAGGRERPSARAGSTNPAATVP